MELADNWQQSQQINAINAIKQNKNQKETITQLKIIDFSFQQPLMLSSFANDISRNYSLPQVQFSALNLSACSIAMIDQIPTKILFISSLFLDNNMLKSLSGIQQFMNLQRLSVNFNYISDKQELLKINHKFLIKELSYIGNPIQNVYTVYGLRSQGFYNLKVVNNVKSIAQTSGNRCLMVSQNISGKNYSFNRSFMNSQYDQQASHFESVQEPYQYVEIQRYDTEDNQKHNMNSSRFVYLTKRQQNGMASKRAKQFESTGDTRKRKLSSYRAIEASRYNNSLQSSPKFNQQHQRTFFTSQYGYRQSLPNRKVTEFNLYPVDEEMTRSRDLESLRQRQGRDYRLSSQQDEYVQKNDFRRIKELHSSMKFERKVNPFEQQQQRRSKVSEQQSYRPYRSEKFRLQNQKYRTENWQSSQEQEQQNDQYRIIERQIPVYKQAIGIAFYYRNLLEKVFRGFRHVMEARIRPHVYHSQLEPYIKKSQAQNKNKRNQEQNMGEIYEQHNKSTNNQAKQEQIQLLRYALMKIQLYSNYRKILEKYQHQYFSSQ